MPVSTWKGHGLRRDLAEMIAAVETDLVRFPGGCFVEGLDLANAPRWKDSSASRRNAVGAQPLGLPDFRCLRRHEFLQWCEDLGANLSM